jgi:hypothetical protein
VLAALILFVVPASLDLPPEGIFEAATVEAPAVRLDPPMPPAFDGSSSNGRCVGAEPLLAYYSPGWDVGRMSRIMYRESRCQPWARNPSGASGLLQIMPMHCRWLPGPCDLFDPAYNVKAGAALWRKQGMGAWAL